MNLNKSSLVDPPASTIHASEEIFKVLKMHLKDASIEQPNAPQILFETAIPEIQITIDSASVNVLDGIYEVTIRAQVNARIDKRILYYVNLEQAGLFEIRNVAENQIAPNLAINCHQIVYANLKENIADLIKRSGFEPIELQEIDFLANYEDALKLAAQ